MSGKSHSFLEILRKFSEFSALTEAEIQDMRWSLKQRVYRKLFKQLPGCEEASQLLQDLISERSAQRTDKSGAGKSASEYRAQFCAVVAAELTRLSAPRGACSVPRLLTDKEANCQAMAFLCARLSSVMKQVPKPIEGRRPRTEDNGNEHQSASNKIPAQSKSRVPVSAPSRLSEGSKRRSSHGRPEWVGVGNIEDPPDIIEEPVVQKRSHRKVKRQPWVGLDIPNSEDSEYAELEDLKNLSSQDQEIKRGSQGTSYPTTLPFAGMESGTVSKPQQLKQELPEAHLEEVMTLRKENASLKRRLEEIETAYNAVLAGNSNKPKSNDVTVAFNIQGRVIQLKNAQIAQLQRQITLFSSALDSFSQVFDDAESIMAGEQRQKLKELRRAARSAAYTKMHYGKKEGEFLSQSSTQKQYNQQRPSQIATVHQKSLPELEINPDILESVASIAHLDPGCVGKLENTLAQVVSDLIQFAAKLRSIYLQPAHVQQDEESREVLSNQLPLSIWKETQAFCLQAAVLSGEVASFQAVANSKQFLQRQGIPDASALIKGSIQKTRDGRIKLLKVLTKIEAERQNLVHRCQVLEAEAKAWRDLVPLLLNSAENFALEAEKIFNDFQYETKSHLADPLHQVIDGFEALQSSPKFSSFLKGSLGADMASFLIRLESDIDSLRQGFGLLEAESKKQSILFPDFHSVFCSKIDSISERISAIIPKV